MTLKERRISSCGYDGGAVSSWRARPARSGLDFSVFFQLSCSFFIFVLFLLLFYFLSSSLFLFSFSFLFSLSLSVACLSASSFFLLGTHTHTHTWHLARFIAHPKFYSSLSFFSSKPIKYRNCRENVPDFRSCLMIDLGRETDGNNEICLSVRFALRITPDYILSRAEGPKRKQ